MKTIVKNIVQEFNNYEIFDRYTPFPKPFHSDPASTRCIVLGADPSNPKGERFEYVFGLEKGERSPYFVGILKNLERVGLKLNELYVQNLCPNYFTTVTDSNDYYIEIAKKYWLPIIKNELDVLFPNNIPVFVTAWKPLTVVAPEVLKYSRNKKTIYQDCIVFNENNLGRPVIALFRGGHGHYTLDKWGEYVETIQKVLLYQRDK